MAFDASQLADFYNQQIKRIYRFFYSRTLNQSIAEDLTSETFLRLAAEISTKDITNPAAFLQGIARNVFTVYLQKKYKQEIHLDLEALNLTEPENLTNTPDPSELILKFTHQLSAPQKQIIEMRLKHKLSLPEVCAELNKPMSYVKTTQNRAIKALRKLLELNDVN